MHSTGRKFKFTLFGESHRLFVGGILEGVPAGFPIDDRMIEAEMALGSSRAALVPPKREADAWSWSKVWSMGRPTAIRSSSGSPIVTPMARCT